MLFRSAMAALDLAILLAPTGREMAEAAAAIDAARATFTRIGAQPLLARLDAVTSFPAPAGAAGEQPING